MFEAHPVPQGSRSQERGRADRGEEGAEQMGEDGPWRGKQAGRGRE